MQPNQQDGSVNQCKIFDCTLGNRLADIFKCPMCIEQSAKQPYRVSVSHKDEPEIKGKEGILGTTKKMRIVVDIRNVNDDVYGEIMLLIDKLKKIEGIKEGTGSCIDSTGTLTISLNCSQ